MHFPKGLTAFQTSTSVKEAWQCFVSGLLPVAALFRQWSFASGGLLIRGPCLTSDGGHLIPDRGGNITQRPPLELLLPVLRVWPVATLLPDAISKRERLTVARCQRTGHRLFTKLDRGQVFSCCAFFPLRISQRRRNTNSIVYTCKSFGLCLCVRSSKHLCVAAVCFHVSGWSGLFVFLP